MYAEISFLDDDGDTVERVKFDATESVVALLIDSHHGITYCAKGSAEVKKKAKFGLLQGRKVRSVRGLNQLGNLTRLDVAELSHLDSITTWPNSDLVFGQLTSLKLPKSAIPDELPIDVKHVAADQVAMQVREFMQLRHQAQNPQYQSATSVSTNSMSNSSSSVAFQAAQAAQTPIANPSSLSSSNEPRPFSLLTPSLVLAPAQAAEIPRVPAVVSPLHAPAVTHVQADGRQVVFGGTVSNAPPKKKSASAHDIERLKAAVAARDTVTVAAEIERDRTLVGVSLLWARASVCTQIFCRIVSMA
jgi:hypothetical protein